MTTKSAFQLSKNLSILGPPGSGKGFYGKPIALHCGVSLLTVSSILRESASDAVDLDSGKLIDCEVVSKTVLDYLHKHEESNKNYILDGFPRTLRQVHLMRTTWPAEKQIHGAFLLDVPDFVCETKMMGRRHCQVCNKGLNTASVFRDGFELPVQLPENCLKCNPNIDWIVRKDDKEQIIKARLKTHRKHENPVVQYFSDKGLLLKYKPLRGERDLADMQRKIEEWLIESPTTSSD